MICINIGNGHPTWLLSTFLSMIDGDFFVASWVVGIMQIWALCWKMRAHISPFTFGKDDKEILLTSMVILHLHRTLLIEGFPTVQHFPMLFRVLVDDHDHLFILSIGLQWFLASIEPCLQRAFNGLKLMTTIISSFLSLCLGLNLPSNGNFWIPNEKTFQVPRLYT
jgi:hypothetical protein